MNFNIHLSTLMLLLLLLNSCGALFEKEIENYDFPDDNQLVITAFLMPQDSLIEIDVRYTYSIDVNTQTLSTEGGVSIPDASVFISDGNLEYPLLYNERKRLYSLSQAILPIEAGKTYFVRATSIDGLSAQANCTIPPDSFEADSIRLNLNSVVEDGRTNYYLRLTHPNAVDKIEYYTLLSQEKRITSASTLSISLEQQLYIQQSDLYPLSFFTSPEFLVKPFASTGVHITDIYICKTDSVYYHYHKSLQDYAIISQNPFSETFNIYSNVENGVGAVAGLNCHVVRL